MMILWLFLACSEKEATTSGLLVSAESLDFGDQPIYTQATQTLTITSQESSEVSILSLTLTGVGSDVWSVERGDDTELSKGEELEISVIFKPEELITTTPELQIRTTLESQDKIYIALSGTGTESIEDSDDDGYSPADGDCNDNDASRYPGAEELCDGKDNDCDDIVPEDEIDADVDGYRLCADDCDDNDYQVYPGAEEICDQKDSDCDGEMPDNEDFDDDGYTLCDGDCADDDPTIWPDNPEICDGIDNNCSGGVDDIDEDGDGYSPCLINGDCDDNSPQAYPIVLDLNAEPDGDGSLDAPYDTLELALENLDPVCRTIVMMPGTYNLNLEWTSGFVAFNGGGASQDEVILENSSGRIADVASDASIRFSNLTIQNSQASGDGGAIRVQGGALTLEQVYLHNNHAVGDGGAVSVSDGTLTLNNVVFESNSSEDDGGAISMLSGVLLDTGSHYISNTGTRGGAILLDVSAAEIVGARFSNNSAGSTGGAIALSAGALFQVEQSKFITNTSTEKGGAIFVGNHAQESSVIRNNIFQGNSSTEKGGAVAFSGSQSGMMVANNTFVDNQTPLQGAAIFGDANDASGLYIWSNIFYGNDGNYALYLMGNFASVGYNSAFLTTSVVPWFFEPTVDVGGNIKEDPNFTVFSNDGDPSNDDLSLSAGSPAIDSGPPNGAPLFYSIWEDVDGSANDRGHSGGQGAEQ